MMRRSEASISDDQGARQGPRAWLLVALSAVLATCAFPPVDAGWLAWIALAPLLLAVTAADRPRSAFWRGYVFGFAHWGTVIYWIGTTVVAWTGSAVGWLAWLGLTGLMSCWFGLFGALSWWIARRSDGVSRALAIAGAWTVVEWLRAQSAYAMPWALIGYSQHRWLALIQVAALTGVWGVSFLVALANAALLDAVRRAAGRLPHPLASAGVFAACFALALIYGATAPAKPGRWTTVRVALMQPDIRTGRGFAGTAETESSLYTRLAAEVAPSHPAILVWPESAADDAARDPAERRVFAGSARTTGAYQLVGSGYEDAAGRQYNAAVLFDPDGAVAGRYDKRHLVPFGEWTPAAGLLAPLSGIFHFPGQTTAGTSDAPLQAGRVRLGALICYESIFPDLTRASVLAGASLLVNLTNDSWSGGVPEEREHAAMTAFRAVETRRSVAIAALTGITGWVAPDGRLTAIPPWREGTLVADVPVPEDAPRSPYLAYGDWFVAVCALLVAGALVRRRTVRAAG